MSEVTLYCKDPREVRVRIRQKLVCMHYIYMHQPKRQTFASERAPDKVPYAKRDSLLQGYITRTTTTPTRTLPMPRVLGESQGGGRP